jgi:hypothetical protein
MEDPARGVAIASPRTKGAAQFDIASAQTDDLVLEESP